MGGDGYVYGLGGGASFNVNTYSQTHRVVYTKYVQLLHVNHTSTKQFFLKDKNYRTTVARKAMLNLLKGRIETFFLCPSVWVFKNERMVPTFKGGK